MKKRHVIWCFGLDPLKRRRIGKFKSQKKAEIAVSAILTYDPKADIWWEYEDRFSSTFGKAYR